MTRKIAGLESDLKIQQQKNASVEKQLEDAECKVQQVSTISIPSKFLSTGSCLFYLFI